jgi:ferredoxin
METVAGGKPPAAPGIAGDSAGGFLTVTIADTGETYRCRTTESLLDGMQHTGKCGIPVGCRGGGCSVCKVAIVTGSYRQFRPMSREYVDDADLAAGRVLACCVQPLTAVTLEVIGKLKKNAARECSRTPAAPSAEGTVR